MSIAWHIRRTVTCPGIRDVRLPYLDHELGDDTVEGRRLEAEALLAGRQLLEVLDSLRHNLAVQSNHDAASILIADFDVEVHLHEWWHM